MSEPVAVTTQEAIDREKATRIASVEQVELENIMELSIMGQVLKWATHMNPSGGLSLCKAVGWNMRSHSHLMAAQRLAREDSPQHVDCDDEGSRRTRNLLYDVGTAFENCQRPIEEGSVVLIVLSKEAAICREASTETLSHDVQLKNVDVGETRVVTNSKCIAEHFRSDRVEKVVMDGPKVVEKC